MTRLTPVPALWVQVSRTISQESWPAFGHGALEEAPAARASWDSWAAKQLCMAFRLLTDAVPVLSSCPGLRLRWHLLLNDLGATFIERQVIPWLADGLPCLAPRLLLLAPASGNSAEAAPFDECRLCLLHYLITEGLAALHS